MSGSAKRRADQALLDLGFAESRSKAQAMVMAGEVWLDDRRIDKPSTLVAAADLPRLAVRRDRQGYVGRGAEKLQPVLAATGWDVRGLTCLDVGASTGGFTEVLLQAGAVEVWAVDVGYGQLHPRLRDDPRVVVRERTNFRHWQPGQGPAFDLAVVDVSFISLTLLLPPLFACIAPDGKALLMVKPQFELERREVPRSGVVADPDLVDKAVRRVHDAALAAGFRSVGNFPAGISGRKGNTEIFLALTRP